MKAMILAAGLGTRLRPLTDDRPKALVELNGRTLLEITLSRLRTFGVNEIIINVHHFADMVVDYLKFKNNFGLRIEISREHVLLDTGGGLKKAAWFFLEDSRQGTASHPAKNKAKGVIPSAARNPGKTSTQSKSGRTPDTLLNNDEPFLLHNVDVLSNIDLARMLQFHKENHALATLAVQSRESSRPLLFNDQLQLSGRRIGSTDTLVCAPQDTSLLHPLAFSGIHFISPRLLPMITEEGVFSIILAYLRLAAHGEKILAFRADEFYWRDLGKPTDLQQAARDLSVVAGL
jgi:NDP-sugar pyrophosphorylase family protein